MPDQRALVVDDDELSRDLLGGMLERLGLQITLAPSGNAALEAISSRAFDLVLLDLKLNDMDGLEVVKHLRERPECGTTRVVVISGADASEGRERCRRAGCDGFLAKPFTYQELVFVLTPLLESE